MFKYKRRLWQIQNMIQLTIKIEIASLTRKMNREIIILYGMSLQRKSRIFT